MNIHTIKQKGFTLIELLVVISIIGLLSSVILGSISSARAKAFEAKSKVEMNQIRIALEQYYSEKGVYPWPGNDEFYCLGGTCLVGGVPGQTVLTEIGLTSPSATTSASDVIAAVALPAFNATHEVDGYSGYAYFPCTDEVAADTSTSYGCPGTGTGGDVQVSSAFNYMESTNEFRVTTGQNNNGIGSGSGGGSDSGSGSGGDVYGCTNSGAYNYNSSATIDDGSCTYNEYGCTDPYASNFSSYALYDDYSCVYNSDVYGCMDPLASNYNSSATVDDATCTYSDYGCMDSGATNYSPYAIYHDYSCTY